MFITLFAFEVILNCYSVTALGLTSSTSMISLATNETFTENVADGLLTNDSITEAVGIAIGIHGDLYISGNIESTDLKGNKQSFATDEAEDRLGGQDLFLLKMSSNRSLLWSKRFGSPGSDFAHGIAVDGKDQIYVAAIVGRNSRNFTAGPLVVKYDKDGTRIWTRNYGSKTAGDKFSGIAVTPDSSEIVVSGTIGTQSPLHTNATRRDVANVVIMRLETNEGEILKLGVAELFVDSAGALGNALTLKVKNGKGFCYVAGTSIIHSGDSRVRNGALYSFSFPDLVQQAKRQVLSQTEDAFVGVATSNNPYSVYTVGIADVSLYSELDGTVARFNSSNLVQGWNKKIGTIEFPDQASIITGLASEAARDLTVDEHGNLYVLLEAASPLVEHDGQKDLKNARGAIRMYSSDGAEIATVQSNVSSPTRLQSITFYNRTALATGWTLDPETRVNKIYLSTLQIPSELYAAHGSEYQPQSTHLEEGQSPNQLNDDSRSSIGIIAGATGGAVGLLVIVAVVVAILMKKRNRGS